MGFPGRNTRRQVRLTSCQMRSLYRRSSLFPESGRMEEGQKFAPPPPREKENTQLKQQHKRCLNRQGCLKLVPQDKGFTTTRRLSSAAKCLHGSQRHLQPALTLRHTLNKCSYCYPWVLKPCHDSECFSLQLDGTSPLDTAEHTL